MKFFRQIQTLLGILAVTMSLSSLAWAAPASKEELLQAVKDAVAKKDTAAIGALFATENADPEMSAMSQGMAAEIVKGDVKDVTFEPLEDDFNPEMVVGTTVYRPNIPILGYIKFDLGGENNMSITMPYGEKDGAYYLVMTTKGTVS